jgi:hypothetical protein
MTTGICTVDGCERLLYARGLCDPHYHRWLHHSDPLAALPIGWLRDADCRPTPHEFYTPEAVARIMRDKRPLTATVNRIIAASDAYEQRVREQDARDRERYPWLYAGERRAA